MQLDAEVVRDAAGPVPLVVGRLVDHRRVETALIRSRGAGPGHIAWLALAEGLLLVVPAVIVAPWLAVAEASVLNFAGPLADIGLSIQPTVTIDSYVLAALATAGVGSFWVLTAAGLTLGLAHSPAQPARAALVAERVPADQLSNANALNALAFSTTLMLGPAVGGFTIALLGAPAAL